MAKYTGRIENMTDAGSRGINFSIVIEDEQSAEVYQRNQFLSTGMLTAQQARDALKNIIDRVTQEYWSHAENAKEVMKDKAVLESYRSDCDEYVDPDTRPKVNDPRI